MGGRLAVVQYGRTSEPAGREVGKEDFWAPSSASACGAIGVPRTWFTTRGSRARSDERRPSRSLLDPLPTVVTGSFPASDPRSLQRLLDVSSEDLLRAVLEFDPVEMTIGVANVLARVCNSVAPLNVTLLHAASGS